jgi:hypothetical protein
VEVDEGTSQARRLGVRRATDRRAPRCTQCTSKGPRPRPCPSRDRLLVRRTARLSLSVLGPPRLGLRRALGLPRSSVGCSAESRSDARAPRVLWMDISDDDDAAVPQRKPRLRPNVLITGTPGTGKTTTAEVWLRWLPRSSWARLALTQHILGGVRYARQPGLLFGRRSFTSLVPSHRVCLVQAYQRGRHCERRTLL